MKQHHYRVTVEHLADQHGVPVEREPLEFETGNHDDIFSIVERMQLRSDFDESETTPLAVGLKLFSEVMLKNREHPLFQELSPHFFDFIKKLKKK